MGNRSPIDQNRSAKQNIYLKKIYLIEEKEEKLIFGGRIELNTPISKDLERIRKIIQRLFRKYFGKDTYLLLSAEEEVNYVMEKLKNYIKSHGGDINVVSVDDESGTVVVSMGGACSLCPSAVVTMKAGIRRLLNQFLPWIKKVEPAEEPKEPKFGFKLAPKPN